MTPKVTLQGENGTTRNFVVNGKFIRFRANVPRQVTREMERRVRNMKKADGTPLFKTTEILVAGPKVEAKKEPVIPNKKVMQHVDGNKDTGWEQRKFV